MANPIRRDFYLFLLFTGLRSEEARSVKWNQVDLNRGIVHFPKTKTDPFNLPLSDFLIDLLKQRKDCEKTNAEFENSLWIFPSHGKFGHIAEAKLSAREVRELPIRFHPHLLRHTYITISENQIAMPVGHARLLVNHALPALGDAHLVYLHPSIDDLKRSQQAVTDFLKVAINPKKAQDNVVSIHG